MEVSNSAKQFSQKQAGAGTGHWSGRDLCIRIFNWDVCRKIQRERIKAARKLDTQ